MPPFCQSHRPPQFLLFTLLGCGILFPWNALLSSLDYFLLLFPGTAIAFDMAQG